MAQEKICVHCQKEIKGHAITITDEDDKVTAILHGDCFRELEAKISERKNNIHVELKAITPNAEFIIVEFARESSSREDKTEEPEKLLKYLIDNNHWSPFEHAMLSVRIVTSRAISTQIIRHWSMRFQEFSQRYSDDISIEPIELRGKSEKNRQSSTNIINPLAKDLIIGEQSWEGWGDNANEIVETFVDTSLDLYKSLIKAGVASECARMILPMATKTSIVMSGTVRSYIHFLELRDDAHAQKEAQVIAKEIKAIFCHLFPMTAAALEWTK